MTAPGARQTRHPFTSDSLPVNAFTGYSIAGYTIASYTITGFSQYAGLRFCQ